MAATSYKDRMAGKSVEELPMIDFEEAAAHVGGGERDPAGLASILAVCFEEVQEQTRQILQGCLAYARDGTTVKPLEEEPNKPRSVVYYVRFYAHKLKSTAGAPLLWRLAKAAEAVELPLKPLAQVEESGTEVPPDDLTALCDAQMKGELKHLADLVREASAALQYISVGMWEALDEEEAEEAREEMDEEEAVFMTQAAADTAVAELEGLLAEAVEAGKPSTTE